MKKVWYLLSFLVACTMIATEFERKIDRSAIEQQAREVPLGITQLPASIVSSEEDFDFMNLVIFKDLNALSFNAAHIIGIPLYKTADGEQASARALAERVGWSFKSDNRFQLGELTLIPRTANFYSLGMTYTQQVGDVYYNYVDPATGKTATVPAQSLGKLADPIMVRKQPEAPWAKGTVFNTNLNLSISLIDIIGKTVYPAVTVEAIGTFYTILGISKDAKLDDIKKAYRKLLLQWHPDKNRQSKEAEELAGEKTKAINLAYETLSDEERRIIYDQTLKQLPTLIAQEAGWSFDAANTFQRGELVIVPRSNQSYSWGVVVIQHSKTRRAGNYIVQVGPTDIRNFKRVIVSAQEIGKWRKQAIMAYYPAKEKEPTWEEFFGEALATPLPIGPRSSSGAPAAAPKSAERDIWAETEERSRRSQPQRHSPSPSSARPAAEGERKRQAQPSPAAQQETAEEREARRFKEKHTTPAGEFDFVGAYAEAMGGRYR